MENLPVKKVDILSYAGKWYALYSIPTMMDKHWKQTTHTYVIHPDGYYAVFSTYKLKGEDKTKYMRSKLFAVRRNENAVFKAQLLWPFKTDYWIIEIAADYSYVVVGHPKCKYLYIMARVPVIEQQLLNDIIDRCSKKGYDTTLLVAQGHPAAPAKKSFA
ncbi:lipocalin family protein [Pedobacter sp. MC2016-14]|uniref:lipocalin family protein n=1 Tax=Pedobacter sp. MC2016-14 TaxID=2897327 RepID=UPI001E2C60AF|nr:lipocalin family protein [Pedobacter sp. MC2016-14]MCD0490291.1 lipocalin family protein [Pedobacter sp. MC2016-14]